MSQRCKDCDNLIILRDVGNGKCSHCHGSGTKNTFANDISGVDTKCSKCKGSGRCPTCNGTGQVSATAPAAANSAPAPILTAGPPATDVEKAWYLLCDRSDFLDQQTVEQFTARLKPVPIAVGLHNFTAETCPVCGSRGQFRIRTLGSLKHSGCGAHWYMRPGGYMAYQVGQIFHVGARAGGSMKDDAYRKGDRTGGIVNGIVGFLFGAVFRAALAVALIPIQAGISLASSKPAPAKPSGKA
jgi:hypothetical protein